MRHIFIILILLSQLKALDTEKTGDTLQILIPTIGYSTALYLGDKEGQYQFYKSLGTTIGITFGLKYSINRQRPNGSDYSFPSGHTSSAFQGASFIHQRYGLKYGWIAYLGASFVGYSRVKANVHYTTDVIAGAIIGTMSSYYFTTPYKDYTITPKQMGSGIGIEVKKIF